MSEFNIYARKLDTAFKEARSEYNTAFRALQDAQQGQRDANAWKPGDSAEEKQVRTTRAALPNAPCLFSSVDYEGRDIPTVRFYAEVGGKSDVAAV